MARDCLEISRGLFPLTFAPRAGSSPGERSAFLSNLFPGSPARAGKSNHKDLMLCRQVQRVLSLELSNDDALLACSVELVEPAPDATHLLVRVAVPAGMDVADVLGALQRNTPAYRFAVAQAITRKRAPSLSFIPVGGSEARHE
ncbi:MAG: hypothetical protein QM770_22120 [Tepidisphaeraceae bacterium]